MRKLSGFILTIIAVVLSAQLAVAQDTGAGAVENLRHLQLQKFESEGGKVEYLGNAYGLDGWLLVKEGMPPQAAYTTRQGGLVMGPLVDPEGIVITQNQLAAWRAKAEGRSQAALPGAAESQARNAETFYGQVEQANWIKAGSDDAPYIYMFMNVTCDHCQNYWKDLQDQVKTGKLQVRLVPFGVQDENKTTGAALLSVADPAAAWTQYINGNKAALSKDKIVEGAAAKLEANRALLAKWNVAATPFTIYRRLNDGKVMVINGRPQNAMMIMADMIK